MWKQEKVIDGVLCYRHSADDEFKPYDIYQLTSRVQKLKGDVSDLIDECNTLNDQADEIQQS